MSETLAEKTCTPCRGGIPPLTGDEAQRLQAQAPNFELGDSARRIERSFRFRKHSLLFKKSVNSPRPKAITPTSRFMARQPGFISISHIAASTGAASSTTFNGRVAISYTRLINRRNSARWGQFDQLARIMQDDNNFAATVA
jgi:hypothetical protein